MPPHDRWTTHNRRLDIRERVINWFLALALLLCVVWIASLIGLTVASAAALFRYAFS